MDADGHAAGQDPRGRGAGQGEPEGTLVVWDEALLGYDLGPGHPMHPVRLELTVALARSLGVLDAPGVRMARAGLAGDELLELVHDPAYLSAVRQAPEDVFGRLSRQFGMGTEDNPVFWRMHEVSAHITGATLAAAEAVWTGTARHAVSIAGGLHHAMRARASGFCVYNDPAVAIAWMLAQGAQRIAYVDVDVHHGDGVQAAFWDDPRVLTVSLHESGSTLFPGTGFPDEVGGRDATGTAVNVALPPFTGDDGWLRAFSGVVPVLLREFRPQVLVTQSGCDTHADDPLAHLTLSVDGQRAVYAWLHRLAHEHCGGRWVATGGGGYELVQVVPRSWTHLLAVAAHADLPADTETPVGWRELALHRGGEVAPNRLTDAAPGQAPSPDGPAFEPWDAEEGDPDSPLDRAVAETRRAVLPLHGLDPLVDR